MTIIIEPNYIRIGSREWFFERTGRTVLGLTWWTVTYSRV